MSDTDKNQAIDWVVNKGYSLSTVAQHYSISVEELKAELNNQ